MLYRIPSILSELGHDMLKVANAPVARVKQYTTTGQRTSFITEHTLIFVLQGKKTLQAGDHTYSVEPGQLFFVKRGIYAMSELTSPGASYEALLLFFTDEFIQQFLYKHRLMPAHNVSAPTSFQMITNPLLEDYKTQFLGYFGREIAGMDAILQLKQQELMLLLLATGYKEQVLKFLQSIAFGQPQDLEYIVRQHLFQPLSLEELARLSGRSLASFKRDFQTHFNSAPRKWINEQRLEHARNLLQHSSKQVAEVAMECGFENTPHFIRIYKQKFGETPNVHRAKNAIL